MLARHFGFTLIFCAAFGQAIRAQDVSSIAGPPAAVGYGADGPVKIRFSSYSERNFAAEGPRLLNMPQTKGYVQKLAQIDADEGFVYVPGETVQIHVKTTGPATIEIRGLRSGRTATQDVDGEQTIPWKLEPAGGKDDWELYQVEARQGGKVVARRGFSSLVPTGDVLACHDVFGTTGWEFIEWAYSPFDIVCGFPEAGSKNHSPLSGRFDYRLQPWNWVTDVYAPDLPKYGMRVADWTKDPLSQPYTEWVRWYQYFGADLTMWTPDSWRWGEFNTGDIEHRIKPPYGDGTPRFPDGNYIVANDSIMPNGMYFREWLGQIYYAAMKQACEMKKGTKSRIAEADHWNDRDDDVVPLHPRLLEMYLDYLKAKGLPHDDLDSAKNSAELSALLTKTGTQERRDHFRAWNMYQVNLRGRQYLWESAVKAAIDVNGFKKVDWIFGNGLVGDTLTIQGQGNPRWVHQDLEEQISPWSRFEDQTDWDYMHWGSGSYRFAGQAFSRMGAVIGRRIFSTDVYNEKVPHADPKSRTDSRFAMWSLPQDAAEHNRLFTYTSFMHYFDSDGHPQRVVNLNYDDVYRASQKNSLGVLTPQTPGPEAHAILDHRQVSEAVTMDSPIGYVGVVSSPRTADIASKTEYVVNPDAWPWYFETLVDDGISMPAFVDANAVDKLSDQTNLIFAPRKDGNGNVIISARIKGQMITRPWAPKDRASLAEFADAIKKAADDPLKFSEGTTGYAYTFRGNQALVYVENMRSLNESESNDATPQEGAHEEPRTAVVDIALPFPSRGAQVWDLTGFLPVTQVQANDAGTRLTFTAPLRAGDGRLFVIVPPSEGSPAPTPKPPALSETSAQDAAPTDLSVPWAQTAYEKVAYRNALFLPTPQPYGPRNYTQLGDADAPPAQIPARVTANVTGTFSLKGTSPLLKLLGPTAIVVGKDAPNPIKETAQALADALKKAGGTGQIFTAEEFDAKPVAESGTYNVLAVGTIWDNEVLQRFNDPWAMDRDWYYGRLGNQPAWPWQPHTGFTVGWVGDFDAKDDSVGYLSVDRSSFMWEARCKAFDDKKAPEQQMPLRFLFRISGSGPAGVRKAAKAFADDGMLNGCLPGNGDPAGDTRFNLTKDRCLTRLALAVPQTVDAGAGHTLAVIGWNQADGEEYDGFFSKTGVEARTIQRAKYVPEWGMTNFVSSPHRASSRFELCVIDVADAESAQKAAEKLGAGGSRVTLADNTSAYQAPYGTLIVVQDHFVILESAAQPWGKALMEAYLSKK
jgi:hypothetical protein